MTVKAYQPLHEQVRKTLDPQYVAIHDRYLQYIQPVNELPWTPALRYRSMGFASQTPPAAVGSVVDRTLKSFRMRVYTPASERPAQGWPVLVWYHGGGWVTGGIESDSSFCSQFCATCESVVVAVDYRLAPENVFPAAYDDAVAALRFVYEDGQAELGINQEQIGIGGLSAGGGLAASAVLAASDLKIALRFQLLIVPVLDNTATSSPGGRWSSKPFAPYLGAERMLWFRQQYLPRQADWSDWRCSPALADEDRLRRLSTIPTWIAVADHDILAEEATIYAEVLRSAGVKVHLETVRGATHSILLLDAVIDSARRLRLDAIFWAKSLLL